MFCVYSKKWELILENPFFIKKNCLCFFFFLCVCVSPYHVLFHFGLTPPVWENAVHLAVAGDVFLVVSCFVLSFFPRDVLDEIWD